MTEKYSSAAYSSDFQTESRPIPNIAIVEDLPINDESKYSDDFASNKTVE